MNKLKDLSSKAIDLSYLAFSIDTVFEEKGDLVAKVHLGKQYVLSEVQVELSENEKKDEELGLLRRHNLGGVSYNDVFKNNSILNWYEDNGYPFARVKVDGVNEEANLIKISVDPGEYS